MVGPLTHQGYVEQVTGDQEDVNLDQSKFQSDTLALSYDTPGSVLYEATQSEIQADTRSLSSATQALEQAQQLADEPYC